MGAREGAAASVGTGRSGGSKWARGSDLAGEASSAPTDADLAAGARAEAEAARAGGSEAMIAAAGRAAVAGWTAEDLEAALEDGDDSDAPKATSGERRAICR